MKKLLIAAAVMFAAVAANAAATTWTINNIQSPTGGKGAADWLVQIYAGDVVYSYDAAKAGTITASDSSTSFATGTIIKATKTFGDFSAGSDVALYAVIYDAKTVADAKNYIVSATLTKTVGEGGGDIAHAFGNMAGTTTTNLFLNSTWESTPEPTSALLMLLGVAGLALRRKQK